MFRYVYDGSFAGLLTALYYIFHRKEVPYEIVSQVDSGNDSILQTRVVETDQAIADDVYQGLVRKNSRQIARDVYCLYLSEQPGFEILLYDFLKKIGKYGSAYASNTADQTMLQVYKTVRKVQSERHRMLGLLRFRNLQNDILYASMEPDHNIVELVAPHFAERLAEQLWIIHDCKRSRAAFYDGTQWVIGYLQGTQALSDMLDDNQLYEMLWKTYFAHIGIAGKQNPKLQKQHLPGRYRKHMTEFFRNENEKVD